MPPPEPELASVGRARLLVWLVALSLLAVLIWASRAELLEVVRGEGRVVPSRKVQVVQNLEGGIVAEILVSEGSLVEPGQVILRIDDTQFASSYQDNQLKVQVLEVRAARLRAELESVPELVFPNSLVQALPALVAEERALFERRREHLDSSLKTVEQEAQQLRQALATARFNAAHARKEQALAQKELDILAPLVTEGVVSGVELIQAEKALLRAQGEAERLQLRIPELETELASMANKRDTLITEFRSLAQEELNRTLSERTRLSNTEGALFDRVTRTQVRSPVKGTVKQLMVNTIGGVVQPGMDIVSIVPIEDTLLIETRIKPSDIARLHPGQRAMVRLSAYDYALYGGLASELEQIGADAVQDERGESFYLVTVRTRQNFLARDGNTLPIIPGMVAEVDIATGSKTVLDYLLRPIRRVADVALTER
jgi:adhesin transport system membrane fusion protein